MKRTYGGFTVTLRGGDGADALSVSGEGGQTAALVFGDAGDDVISLAGGLSATVDGGAGLDSLRPCPPCVGTPWSPREPDRIR